MLQPRAQTISDAPGVDVPLGPVPLTLTCNVDFAPAIWGGAAVSMQVTHLSSREDTDNGSGRLARLPHWVSAYAMSGRANTRMVAAARRLHLTDATGLHVSSVGQVLPEDRRRYVLTVAADY